MERRSLVLDSGAVIALTRGDRAVRKVLEAAHEAGADIIVPHAVVTQTARGEPQDAALRYLLSGVWVPFVGKRLALAAGALLAQAGLSDAADAQVMAEAIRSGPALLLTSDIDDMTRLGGGRPGVRIVRV